MKLSVGAFALICLGFLAGCETIGAPEPQLVWMRLDGQRMTGNPEFEKQFYAAQYACQSNAMAARAGAPPAPATITMSQSVQIGGQPPPPRLDRFDSSRFIAAAEAGQRNADADALLMSCMNANGYRLTTPPT